MVVCQSVIGYLKIVGVVQDVILVCYQEDIQLRYQWFSVFGEFVGGIVYDFNNILIVINVSFELLMEIDDFFNVCRVGVDIYVVGLRVVDLVWQLMVFGCV